MRAENESLHRENRQLRTELMEMRRLAEESGRYQRLLGPARRDARRDDRGARDRRRRLAVLPGRARRHRPRRGDGPPRHAGADPGGGGRPHQPRRRARARTCCCWSIRARRWTCSCRARAAAASCAGKSGENGYRCSIEYLARGEPVKEGDAVVTSGVGGAFPRNLAVGHVTAHHPGRGRPVPGRRGHARRRLRAPDRRAGRGRAAAGAGSRSGLAPHARRAAWR